MLGLFVPGRAGAADAGPDSPEGAVGAAYAELGALLWAPRSKEREEEIAQLLARDVDFEELTRRAFGDPCPRPGCTDHWAEFSIAQRAEIEPLFAAVVTRQWTHELDKASGYNIDVQPAVTHGRDARVRVFARPKSDPSQAPIVVDTFFLANRAPYRLVDVDVDGSRLARNHYKQFDRTLRTPGEGYVYLVSRLRKKVEKSPAAREVDADLPAAADDEPDAAPASNAPASKPTATPPTHSVPWLPIALGGAATVAVGAWFARRHYREKGEQRIARPEDRKTK
jgi:ABC-type transporter MlaC component